uniref:(California timema) hypothetical protein n=1 Tax=Timema californicum TaxID=61474 RepID=A0A7R9PCV6_TIMCA|nr:unnamed protein product [Timema californicum]
MEVHTLRRSVKKKGALNRLGGEVNVLNMVGHELNTRVEKKGALNRLRGKINVFNMVGHELNTYVKKKGALNRLRGKINVFNMVGHELNTFVKKKDALNVLWRVVDVANMEEHSLRTYVKKKGALNRLLRLVNVGNMEKKDALNELWRVVDVANMEEHSLRTYVKKKGDLNRLLRLVNVGNMEAKKTCKVEECSKWALRVDSCINDGGIQAKKSALSMPEVEVNVGNMETLEFNLRGLAARGTVRGSGIFSHRIILATKLLHVLMDEMFGNRLTESHPRSPAPKCALRLYGIKECLTLLGIRLYLVLLSGGNMDGKNDIIEPSQISNHIVYVFHSACAQRRQDTQPRGNFTLLSVDAFALRESGKSASVHPTGIQTPRNHNSNLAPRHQKAQAGVRIQSPPTERKHLPEESDI